MTSIIIHNITENDLQVKKKMAKEDVFHEIMDFLVHTKERSNVLLAQSAILLRLTQMDGNNERNVHLEQQQNNLHRSHKKIAYATQHIKEISQV